MDSGPYLKQTGLTYAEQLVLQLQGHVERIDLVSSCTRAIVKQALAFNITIPAISRDPSIVARDDVVDTIFPLLPHGAVQWIDAGESRVRLEPSDTDFVRDQVQTVDRP